MEYTTSSTAHHYGDPNEMLQLFRSLWKQGRRDEANDVRICAKDLRLNRTVKLMNQYTDEQA